MDVAGRACTLTLAIVMLTHNTLAAQDLLVLTACLKTSVGQVLPDNNFLYTYISLILTVAAPSRAFLSEG